MPRPIIYTLDITCPLCQITAHRDGTAPFIYLDADGLQAHSAHEPGCAHEFAEGPVAYSVVRSPNDYRQLPGDPLPPEGGA